MSRVERLRFKLWVRLPVYRFTNDAANDGQIRKKFNHLSLNSFEWWLDECCELGNRNQTNVS